MKKNQVDYYNQGLTFLDLVKDEGGYVESAQKLKKRVLHYLTGEGVDYFYVECQKAIIRLKGFDEVGRVYEMVNWDLEHDVKK